MKYIKKNKTLLLIPILFIILVVAIILSPSFDFQYGNSGNFYINEVMSSNDFSYLDDDLKSVDWIELYNGYNYDINLEGYSLSDRKMDASRWSFPEGIVIKAKSYLVVFASGKDKCDIETNICHTNFSLSSSGETVTLSDQDSGVISRVVYEETTHDTSYGKIGSKYGYMINPTPNEENIGPLSTKPILNLETKDITLLINEYITNNERSNYDADGDYTNWVEIYNYGDKDIDIEGMFISDRTDTINKYELPKYIVKSHEYKLIYLSGKNKTGDEIHTSFKLSDNDTMILLSDKYGSLIDKIDIVALKDNVSYGRSEDKWYYYPTPTPGTKNTTQKFESVDGILNKVAINEVSGVSNNKWIELYNKSEEVVNLKNYKLYDKSGSNVYTFPDVSVNPNSTIVVYSKGSNEYAGTRVSSNIKINHSGDIIYLENNDGLVIDEYSTGRLINNVSSGISKDGTRVYYKNLTPGNLNNDTFYLGYSSTPSFSLNGGYVEEGTIIYLTTDNKSTIYYTLDGSYPNNNSILYKDGIKIDKTTVIKAISYKDGYIESEIISRTFFVGRTHDLAVVSLSTNADNLYSNDKGLLVKGWYNNYRQDWERPISFEFYENGGTFGISFNGGVKLVGQDSRNFPQMSMAIYLREEYGLDEINYPFFKEDEVTTFSSFTLRNSGEDVGYLKLKDAFLTETLRNMMDIDMQRYRAVVVYINGQYYGLYNIREKINESYLANNHGIDPDNVDLIKGNSDVRSGTYENYSSLIYYMQTHNGSNDSVYAYLESQIDVQELCNYWVVQTYYRNTDTGNIRFYRERTSTGKWRWVLFDLDWALFPSTYRSPQLFYPFRLNGHGAGRGFSTRVTYTMYQNYKFRDLYLKTLAKHMETTFKPDRMAKLLDEMANEIRSEMPYHIQRWYNEFASAGVTRISSLSQWESSVATLRNILYDRYNIVKNNIKSEFGLSTAEYNNYFGGI